MGFNDILKKLFGDKAKRDMRELSPYVEKINTEWERMKNLSNDELRAVSLGLQERIRDRISGDEERISSLKEDIEVRKIPVEEREKIFQYIVKTHNSILI